MHATYNPWLVLLSVIVAILVSYTALTNERSTAVMLRLGMRESGRFDHPRVAEGHRLRPHRLLRLGREQFQSAS